MLFLVAFLLFYMWHMMGVTIGYHRLLSHRSFRCPKLVEYFWVMAGYLAFEGSPIWWATVHRAHHRYTDQPLDPHSPQSGWKYSYYGWIFHRTYSSQIDPAVQAPDLVKDKFYSLLEQGGDWHRAHTVCVAVSLAFRVLLLCAFGWEIALASLLAGGIVQQVPLLLNFVCHLKRLGYRNYATPDDSVNVWWVAWLTAGEGWHNNHHAFPGSARSGIKPWEIDLSWITIRLMRLFGLAQVTSVAVSSSNIPNSLIQKERENICQ